MIERFSHRHQALSKIGVQLRGVDESGLTGKREKSDVVHRLADRSLASTKVGRESEDRWGAGMQGRVKARTFWLGASGESSPRLL
jgi:hypothetical protein